MKWFLRGCPVCGGALYEEVDRLPERSVSCFMCGRHWGLKLEGDAPAVSRAPVGPRLLRHRHQTVGQAS
jgi:hypothetical protein